MTFNTISNIFLKVFKAPKAKQHCCTTNEQLTSWMHSLNPTAYIEDKCNRWTTIQVYYLSGFSENLDKGRRKYNYLKTVQIMENPHLVIKTNVFILCIDPVCSSIWISEGVIIVKCSSFLKHVSYFIEVNPPFDFLLSAILLFQGTETF